MQVPSLSSGCEIAQFLFAIPEHHECQHLRSHKHAGSTMIPVIDLSCELDRHIGMLI
jgi:hypothetical protein